MARPAEGVKLFTDLVHVDPLFWETLRQRDPAQAAFRTGTFWDGRTFRVELLDRTYLVDPEKKTVVSPKKDRISFQEGLVLLAYLGGEGPGGVAGARIPLRNLPGGELFFAKTHTPATDDLAQELELDAEGFLAAGERLGARPTGQGEASWLLMALPQIPLEAVFFSGDEEFPPKITVIIDRAASNYLHLDGVWAMVNLLRNRIKAVHLQG